MAKPTLLFLTVAAIMHMWPRVTSLQLDSFLLDAMDDTMLTMERDRASVDFTREIEIPKAATPSRTAEKTHVEAPVERLSDPASSPLSSSPAIPLNYRMMPLPQPIFLEPVSRKKEKIKFAYRKWKRPEPKTKKIKVPKNKNLHAMSQILTGMLEASAMSTGISLSKIEQQILDACKARKYAFARHLVGHNIYHAKGKVKKDRRARRSTMSTKELFNKIKSRVGDESYKILFGEDGAVTLAFAVDTTGSMEDDIKAAKEIVRKIVMQNEKPAVDYILSPFNDPKTDPFHGPVTYKNSSEKLEFLGLVDKLKADGGGDCSELAIDGISEIFTVSMENFSPIYVLTDAGAKDATDEYIEALKAMISTKNCRINFFLSKSDCLEREDIKMYKSIAQSSGGKIMYFSDKKRVKSTLNLIERELIGSSSLPVIPTKQARERRAITQGHYTIAVDDNVEVFSTSVMDHSEVHVELYNPVGQVQIKGKLVSSKSTLFLVENPIPGLWRLSCPSCSQSTHISSTSVSNENIDFQYHFQVEVLIRRKPKSILANHPIKGQKANLMITVPAHAKTHPWSLKINVVDKQLRTIYTAKLEQYGRAPGKFKGSFPKPSHEFSLILEGKTKQGHIFKRLANGVIKPKTNVLYITSAPRGYELHSNGRSSTILIFELHCYDGRERFDVNVIEHTKFSIRKPRGLYCIPNRMVMFIVSFKANGSAKAGNMHNAVVTVKSKRSGDKTSKHVQLLIV